MLNKLSAALRSLDLVQPGDTVVCAVSGGADSAALLFGMYLLKDRYPFELRAAHFNHHLRGAESDADEQFVRDFCSRYEIPLTVGGSEVRAGAKGLEAAAREARYAFLRSLPGWIATAHTADDNAETVLMHLIRGTGLKGLGAIAPVNNRVIRPMLGITRAEVEAFLEEYCLPHREDSSNATNQFLRNRIRHDIMPLLRAENPSFSENVSAMAQRLRLDEAYLQSELQDTLPDVSALRELAAPIRRRYLERFLKESGVPEPEQSHLEAVDALVFSDKPSAAANLPGKKTIARNYDRLELRRSDSVPDSAALPQNGITELPQWGIRVVIGTEQGTSVRICGPLTVRTRLAGDEMRLNAGTKSLKKLWIDRKIPAADRPYLPILADEKGVIYAGGIGFNLTRLDPEGIRILVENL